MLISVIICSRTISLHDFATLAKANAGIQYQADRINKNLPLNSIKNCCCVGGSQRGKQWNRQIQFEYQNGRIVEQREVAKLRGALVKNDLTQEKVH